MLLQLPYLVLVYLQIISTVCIVYAKSGDGIFFALTLFLMPCISTAKTALVGANQAQGVICSQSRDFLKILTVLENFERKNNLILNPVIIWPYSKQKAKKAKKAKEQT